MWFSANVMDVTTGDTARSKVLYVELLSPTGVVLQQQKLRVVDGRCHGAFPLVDASVKEANAMRGMLGYPSGYYEVRAYTRSMLNFDANGCFSRVFPVYETPEKEGDYANSTMKQYLRKEEIRPEAKHSKGLDVAFFPEGGRLVIGVESRIAQIVYGIPAVKSLEFGLGDSFSVIPGSESNDDFILENGEIKTQTNNCGGILGGITNGMPLIFAVTIKPTPSISKPQQTVNLETGEVTTIQIKGRHDPCIVPRAVPVVEAAAAIAIFDAWLEYRARS